jgi:prepilin-type N-terminal cleavage/methylation domain-containing protein
MQMLSAKARISGFTLIELLVVICVIVVLAAMLFPILTSRARFGGGRSCMNNQMQIALGFLIFKDDHGGKFPWQLPATNGGTMELAGDGHPSSQFRMALDYIQNYHVWICPTDPSRHPATNNATFGDINTSDFVNVDATTNNAAGILTGERHLMANGLSVKPGLFNYKNTSDLGWTLELHGQSHYAPYGAMSFTDGHAEFVRGATNLNVVFRRQGVASSRLAVP